MFLVRDVFQLKFGMAREAKEIWKEMAGLNQQATYGPSRCYTDFTGPSYRLIIETPFENLGEYEKQLTGAMAQEEWQKAYRRLVSLVESSYREILRVVE